MQPLTSCFFLKRSNAMDLNASLRPPGAPLRPPGLLQVRIKPPNFLPEMR